MGSQDAFSGKELSFIRGKEQQILLGYFHVKITRTSCF